MNEYTGFAAEQFLRDTECPNPNCRSPRPHRHVAIPDPNHPGFYMTGTVPLGPPSIRARVHLAWLMWCYQEGYKTAEDRAIMENWMGEHQDNAEDEATRQILLTMADEVLAALADEAG